MKKRILLIDESLTVQKVVSLTLDKDLYDLAFARNRKEAVTEIKEQSPDLILLSEQMREVKAQSFPKEMEAWLGRDHDLPRVVLITSQNISAMKHYAGVLKKPFTPQSLEEVVSHCVGTESHALTSETDDWEAREAVKVVTKVSPKQSSSTARETAASHEEASTAKKPDLMSAEDSLVYKTVAYKSVLENEVLHQLESHDFDAAVKALLDKLVPPIVERLVGERLDKLMREQELNAEA